MHYSKIVTDIGRIYRLGLKIVRHSEEVMKPSPIPIDKLHELQHGRIQDFKRSMKKTSVDWFNNEYSINKHWTGLD